MMSRQKRKDRRPPDGWTWKQRREWRQMWRRIDKEIDAQRIRFMDEAYLEIFGCPGSEVKEKLGLQAIVDMAAEEPRTGEKEDNNGQ